MSRSASSWRVIIAIAFLLYPVIDATGVQAGDSRRRATVLRDVRLFSGRGDSFEDHVSIKIENGVITEIARKIDAAGARVVQLQNRPVIPGLIDAHVHLNSIPGSIQRQDDVATTKRFFAQQMRAYLASGVTSVLDAAAPPSSKLL